MRTLRLLAALIAVLLAGTLLTACSDDVSDPVIVGHDGTPEMRTAAAVYAGALARTGQSVRVRAEASTAAELLDGVASGELGLYPAYTGNLLRELTPAPEAVVSDRVVDDVNRSLPQQVSIGDPALVSDRWQVLARTDSIERVGITDLSQCGRFGVADLPLVVVEAPPQPELDAIVSCVYGKVVRVPTVDELVKRVRAGNALGFVTALDAASVTDLSDVQAIQSAGAPIAQDLVPVYVSGLMSKPQLKALSRVAGELTTADLADLVAQVRSGADPGAVARRWLSMHGV